MYDAQGCAAPEGECGYIRQYMSACVATNMLHFRHSKNLPEHIANRSAYYIAKDSHCDYNISMMFIYIIHLISFNHGSLLKL